MILLMRMRFVKQCVILPMVLFFLTPLFKTWPAYSQEEFVLSNQDRQFLEMIQKDSFEYFMKYRNASTGLILDSSAAGSPASIAATGFALAAYGIAKSHGWIGYRDAYELISKTLATLENSAANKNGFYFHFLDPKTGKRTWSSEASSIDTALLIAGALIAGEYFPGTDIQARARALYEAVDWKWMLNGSLLISHGWKPERGFLPHYWDMYSEHLILQALALGSPTHPIPEAAWNEWDRLEDQYNGRKVVYSFSGSLFTYHFSHAFIDFRNLNDRGINYFSNSREAVLANKEFCWDNRVTFPSYSEHVWGLSASLGPDGYKAYGAQPGVALHDGTIAPYAIASSVPFAPEESIKSLRAIYDAYGKKIYGPYGFRDSMNLEKNWWANDYLGIDQGIVVLMLENYLNDGAVWKRFSKLAVLKAWAAKCKLLPE